ncbi:MAG: vesicular-fusion protein SEC17 [Amphiamblys sp. WSBS2006]|nr:MAG: vesicular-fusion protein SEC17 [Amphiamblys sp. WSBS2006]
MNENPDDLVAEAEKCLKRRGWFSSPDYEKASGLYVMAGDVYKINQEWESAHRVYVLAGDIHTKLGDSFEAGIKYRLAADAIKTTRPEDAASSLECSADLLFKNGRLGMAARALKEAAEILEKHGNTVRAAELYLKAAKVFDADRLPAAAIGVSLSAGALLAESGKYDDAAGCFLKATGMYLKNNATHTLAQKYIFNTALCLMGTLDAVCAQKALDEYTESDTAFRDTKEFQFLCGLVSEVESGDSEEFEKKVAEHDRLVFLDHWRRALLEKIARRIEESTLL